MQTQGLSQIREDVQEEHTPKVVEDREDDGRHPCTQAETMALLDAWISTSNDPILGNQQTRKCFWDKVTNVYNTKKPTGAFSRNLKMLCTHFERADRDVKIFCGIYKREAEQYQSGASVSDMLRAALRVFKSDTGKDFKFPDVWEVVKHLDRWPGGVDSSTGSSSKRTKHTTGG
ncbi:glutathione S-transferase T3-like [Salvia splendens]|uniref:glutathione S-transferase T3-like n=1 Tax=Salvia splendens TaxID=180675 RepID=UPI001C2598AF|nr:glutathione S-transferase T3-like [Salvia splendens]